MRAFPAFLALCCGAALLALSGCRPAAPIVFHGLSGPLSVREERTPETYRLQRAVAAGPDQAFFLEYRGSPAGKAVQLLSPEGEVVARRRLLDAGEDVLRVLVPLSPERRFSRIEIRPATELGFASEPGPGDGQVSGSSQVPLRGQEPDLRIEGMGLTGAESGLVAAGGVVAAGPQVGSWRRDGHRWEVTLEQGALPVSEGEPAWRLELLLEGRGPYPWAHFRAAEGLAGAREGGGTQRALGQVSGVGSATAGVLYRGLERTAAVITVSDGVQERRFLHRSLPGVRRLYLYPGVVPFVPLSVRIEPLGGSRLWLERLTVAAGEDIPLRGQPGGQPAAQPAARPLQGPLAPLPADLGVILLYDRARWRSQAYELFSWSRFPEVLVFDTADYSVQSRFFKRLAFFVEKRGFRGRLVTNQEVADLHGYNAHDYRAEDLARFFQEVAEAQFPLNPEEEQLQAILLANGILRIEGGRYAPGEGSVLSISRSSGPLLRRHLLTHEAFHGVFFSSPAYRERCFELWDALGEQERAFWLLFFRWMRYDTGDSYLSANELQAYLFQQERRGVGSYLRGVVAGRLVAAYPERRGEILRFLSADPGAFERRFDALEPHLIAAAGLEGGWVVELESLEGR